MRAGFMKRVALSTTAVELALRGHDLNDALERQRKRWRQAPQIITTSDGKTYSRVTDPD